MKVTKNENSIHDKGRSFLVKVREGAASSPYSEGLSVIEAGARFRGSPVT